MTDLAFLYSKCSLGLVTSLNSDYSTDLPIVSSLAQRKWANTVTEMEEYAAFVYKNTHHLIRYGYSLRTKNIHQHWYSPYWLFRQISLLEQILYKCYNGGNPTQVAKVKTADRPVQLKCVKPLPIGCLLARTCKQCS